MNKLHKLPSGDWIDLSCICAVTACQSCAVARLRDGDVRRIDFNTYEEACAYRDELAGLVNDARAMIAGTIPPQSFDYTLKPEKVTVVRDGVPSELTVLVVEP